MTDRDVTAHAQFDGYPQFEGYRQFEGYPPPSEPSPDLLSRITPRRVAALYAWNGALSLWHLSAWAAFWAPMLVKGRLGWMLFGLGGAAELAMLAAAFFRPTPQWLREIRNTRQAIRKRKRLQRALRTASTHRL